VPHEVAVGGAIGSLIADLIAILVGAYFYKEA
jgi:putative Ca2+/H+ antiporter (TMEM165/GDT1 family)